MPSTRDSQGCCEASLHRCILLVRSSDDRSNRQPGVLRSRSGPARYDYEGGDWLYRRDGHLLHDKLEAELGELMDGPVSLSRPTSGTTDP